MRLALRRLVAPLLLLTALLAPPTLAQTGEETISAQQQVILNQLDAFNRTDGIDAFSYASPSIRAMFRDWPTFMTMVERGYGPIYRNAEARFVAAGTQDARPYHDVTIRGQDGSVVTYRYFMEQQQDGSWRIDGVTPLPGGQV